MLTAEDTARRTPGLANVRTSGQTVRRRLRESGFRTRRPVVAPILKQRHRTVQTVVGGFTPGNAYFLVMNPDFHFALEMDVIVCIAGVGNILRTSVCTSQTVLETEVLWSGLEYVMMVALSSKLLKEH